MFSRDEKTAPSWEDIWEIGTKWFLLGRKSGSASQNKEFVVKIIYTRWKKALAAKSILKIGKKWFLLARKPVSTSLNEGFVSKIALQCLKNR